jgi:hypothetical protein
MRQQEDHQKEGRFCASGWLDCLFFRFFFFLYCSGSTLFPKHFLFLNRHYTHALRLSLNDLRSPPVCLHLGGIVYKSGFLAFFPLSILLLSFCFAVGMHLISSAAFWVGFEFYD